MKISTWVLAALGFKINFSENKKNVSSACLHLAGAPAVRLFTVHQSTGA